MRTRCTPVCSFTLLHNDAANHVSRLQTIIKNGNFFRNPTVHLTWNGENIAIYSTIYYYWAWIKYRYSQGSEKKTFNDVKKAAPSRRRLSRAMSSPSPTKAIRTSKIYKSILAFHYCLSYWVDCENGILGKVMRSVSQGVPMSKFYFCQQNYYLWENFRCPSAPRRWGMPWYTCHKASVQWISIGILRPYCDY